MASRKKKNIYQWEDVVFLWIDDKLATYTDCAEIMRPILEMPIWSWHWKADGRVGAVPSKEARKMGIVTEPYLYQLRWAVEYYGAKPDCVSIARALNTMREDFKKNSLNIDHLDNNHRNCCLWNLAAMTRSQNAAKSNLTERIKEPFFWLSVNDGGGYRVVYGNDVTNPKTVYCTDNEKYIELLKSFYKFGVDSECSPSEIQDGERICYGRYNNLTDPGEEFIKKIRIAPREIFLPYKPN